MKKWMQLYRARYMDWNVKHFHEHACKRCNYQWTYTWTKKHLHHSGLVDLAGFAVSTGANGHANPALA